MVGHYAISNAARHAFVYSRQAGVMDLGTLGGQNSLACGINDRGEVVGFADGAANVLASSHDSPYTQGQKVDTNSWVAIGHAFLYSHGRMVDLNSLVAMPAGWILLAANCINDSGEIAGYGRAPDGNMRGVCFDSAVETGDNAVRH